ncbi:unnamed protein product [Enterobius vermicularis]|uniref:Phage infection protein n=1 Tax=Enterobius vermicularis TaxID=51028 RepID=A0A0N4VBF0_ENTVE|nr:unnamed protein product [Enterobius vermicularis]
MSLYGASVQDTNDNIDYSGPSLNGIANDMKSVVDDSANNLICEANQTFDSLFGKIINMVNEFEDSNINSLEVKYGLKNVEEFFGIAEEFRLQLVKTKDLTEKAITEVQEPEKKKLQDLLDQLNNITETIEQFDVTTKATNTSREALNSVTNDLAQAITPVEKKIEDIRSMLMDIQSKVADSSARSSAFSGAKAIILVPVTVVAASVIFVLVFGVLRIFQRIAPKIMSKFLKVGGKVATFGIVLTFIISWIIMALSTIMFFGGFGIEAGCKVLFRDEDMKIFKHIPYLDFEIPNHYDTKNAVKINVGDVFKQCSKNSSIYTVFQGDKLINETGIMNDIDLPKHKNEVIKAIQEHNITFTFPDTHLATTKGDTDNLQSALDGIGDQEQLKDVKDNGNKLIEMLRNMTTIFNETLKAAKKSEGFINDTIVMVDDLFSNLSKTVPNLIGNVKNDLRESVYPCRPVYDLWQNIGALGCDRMGKPVQGVWTSLGLIAVLFIPTVILMIIVSGILYEKYQQNDYAKRESDVV